MRADNMAGSIFKNKVEVFRSSVGVLECLYNEMNDVVEQEEVETNEEFDRFMEKLEETSFTLGGTLIDIQRIFTQSKNLDLLITLVERAIYVLRSQVREYVVEKLWKFHAELIKYKEELEAAGK